MSKRILVGRDDKGVDIYGEYIGYSADSEPWYEFRLADGNTLKLKVVVTGIIKTDAKNEQGEPVYLVKSQNVLTLKGEE